jgi:hypothetical protein
MYTTVLSGPLAVEVAELKRREGKAIVATGSVQLAQTLVRTLAEARRWSGGRPPALPHALSPEPRLLSPHDVAW